MDGSLRHRVGSIVIVVGTVVGLLSSALAGPKRPDASESSHDLNLPRWGPYSNAYLGVSHIPDLALGMRFDITVFAGPHTISTPDVPYAALNTGFVAWKAAPFLPRVSPEAGREAGLCGDRFRRS